VDKGRGDRDSVNEEKKNQVFADDSAIHVHIPASLAERRIDNHGKSRDEKSERGQHERRARNRADADVVGACAAGEENGDDGDHGLRQRGADCRKNAPDDALVEIAGPTEAFNCIDKNIT
jgi:hypothetical protein